MMDDLFDEQAQREQYEIALCHMMKEEFLEEGRSEGKVAGV